MDITVDSSFGLIAIIFQTLMFLATITVGYLVLKVLFRLIRYLDLQIEKLENERHRHN